MKKINLLPEKVQKAKDVRRITIVIAAVQTAVFLAAIVLFVLFSMWGARLNREAQSLDDLLRQSAAGQSSNETIHYFLQGEFLTKDALTHAQAAPHGVWLYALTFNHGEFSITAHTSDILNIQAHIKNLSEIFYGVRMTSLAATGEGGYVYELIFFQDNQAAR